MRYIFSFIYLLMCFQLNAATYYASNTITGTSGSGTLNDPWSLTNAIEQASAGDTVNAGAGVYNTYVLISKIASAGNYLTIQGEPGAIIDPSTDLDSGWSLASEWSSGLVYKHASPGYEIGGLLLEGKNLDGIWKSNITEFEKLNYPTNQVVTDPAYSVILSNLPFWDGLEASYYQTNADTIYFRFWGGGSPNGRGVKINKLNAYDATTITDVRDVRAATVMMKGAAYVKLRGFEIRGGRFGIGLRNNGNDGSHDNIIESNYIHHGLDMILLKHVDSGGGYNQLISGSNNIIRYNTLSEDRWGTNVQYGAWSSIDSNSWPLANAYGWNKMRYGDTFEGWGIYYYFAGPGNVAYGNIITNVCGGISTISSAASSPYAADATFYSNYFNGNSGAAYSINRGVENLYIYENDIINSHYPFRINEVNLTTSYDRTVYILNNRVSVINGRGDMVYVHALGESGTAGEPYVWLSNNSFSGGRRAFHIGVAFVSPLNGLPYFRVINNIFSTEGGVFDTDGGNYNKSGGFGIWDNNIMHAQGGSHVWFGGTNTITGVYEWDTNSVPDFKITSASDAWNYGVDVSQTFTYSATPYSALPTFDAGYFTNSQPNSGWFQFDEEPEPPTPGRGNIRVNNISVGTVRWLGPP